MPDEPVVAPPTPARAPLRLNYVRGYGVGMWAFLLQRFSGLLLMLVIFAHFWSRVLVPSWGLAQKATDMAMIVLVAYHAFAGLRVVLVDLGVGMRTQRAIFWGVVALGLLTAGAALLAYQQRFP